MAGGKLQRRAAKIEREGDVLPIETLQDQAARIRE